MKSPYKFWFIYGLTVIFLTYNNSFSQTLSTEKFNYEWAQRCADTENVPFEKRQEFINGLKLNFEVNKRNKLFPSNNLFREILNPPSPLNSYCSNLGFENGNLGNWNGATFTGTSDWPIPPAVISNWVNGFSTTGNNAPLGGWSNTSRHTVMTIPPGNNNPAIGPLVGYDSMAINPITGLADIPFLPPNSNGSVLRLGNANVGSEAEKVSYKLTVSTQNAQLNIQYAVVLNDAMHPAGQQPFFQMITRDQLGKVINGCGVYAVDATNASSDPAFTKSQMTYLGDVYYKKWTNIGLDLTAYIGQTVTIEFVSADCSQGGHFGYAYIDASCFYSELSLNFCSGSSTAIIVGPGGYSNYQWFGPNSMTPIAGATNDSLILSNPVAGDVYYLNSVAANGCSTQMHATIKNTSVNVLSTSAMASCIGGNTGSVNVVPSGSSNGYNYVWTNSSGMVLGGNSSTLTNLGVGTYSVSISSPGCGSVDTTVEVPQVNPFLISSTQNYCGTSANILAPPGGTNYVWYNSTGSLIPSPLGDTLFVNNINPGVTYIAVYNNTNGCRDSLVITLNQITGGNLSFANVTNVCPGSSNGSAVIQLSTTQTGPYQWTINGSNGYTNSSNNSSSQLTLNSLASGTYSVTVYDLQCFYSGSFSIDTISIPVSVTVNPLFLNACDTAKINFVYGLGGSPIACQLSSAGCNNPSFVNVGAINGQNIFSSHPSPYGNWYSNEKYQILYRASELLAAGIRPGKLSDIAFEVLNIPLQMNTTFNNYTIKIACTPVSDLGAMAFGGSFISAPFQTVFGPKTINVATGWNKHDFSQAYEWDGSSNLVVEICYDWLNTTSYSSNAIVNNTTTPYYSFAVFNSDVVPSCTSNTASASFKKRPVTRVGNCMSVAQPSDFNYLLTPSTGVIAPGKPSITHPTISILPTSTQTYQLTTTTLAGGCSRIDTFTLHLASPFNLSVSSDTAVCNNHSPIIVKATTTDAVTGAIIQQPGNWSGMAVSNQANGIGVFNPAQAGAGNYNLIYTAGNCLNRKDTVKIKVNPFLKASFNAIGRPFCIYDPATQLTALSLNQGGVWSINGIASTNFNPAILGSSTPPHFQLKYLIDQGFGCPDSSVQQVIVYDKPLVSFTSDTTEGCLPDLAINFNSQVNIPNGQYLWDFGDNTGSVNLPNPVHIYNKPNTFTVTLYYISLNGCKDTAQVKSMIISHPLPKPEFTASPEVTTTLDPTVEFYNLSPDAQQLFWHWTIGQLDSSFSKNTSYTFPREGVYNVTLTATNANGCKASITHPVTVNPDFVFYTPNGFTPNGDGLNDVFLPVGEGIQLTIDGIPSDYLLSIYNRWGEKIFESANTNIGWNGQYYNIGYKVQADIYIYVVNYTTLSGIPHSKTGTLSLIR